MSTKMCYTCLTITTTILKSTKYLAFRVTIPRSALSRDRPNPPSTLLCCFAGVVSRLFASLPIFGWHVGRSRRGVTEVGSGRHTLCRSPCSTALIPESDSC